MPVRPPPNQPIPSPALLPPRPYIQIYILKSEFYIPICTQIYVFIYVFQMCVYKEREIVWHNIYIWIDAADLVHDLGHAIKLDFGCKKEKYHLKYMCVYIYIYIMSKAIKRDFLILTKRMDAYLEV